MVKFRRMSDDLLLQRRFERERKARKEAERLLEQKSIEIFHANQRLDGLARQTRAIVETAAEGIVTYSHDGRIDLFNRSAARIFERDDANEIGIRQLFKMTQNLEQVLFPQQSGLSPIEGGHDAEPVEIQGVTQGGRQFCAEVAISRSGAGDDSQYTMLVRDLTRKKTLEARLAQAQKMESVGQLASGIAHEINTPIQFVNDNMLFLEGAFGDLGKLLDLFDLLAKRVENGEAADDLIERIRTEQELADLPFLRSEFPGAIAQSLEGIQRVATIVRAMKEFSQTSTENKTATQLNRMIENSLTVIRNQADQIANIETELDPEVGDVVCLSGPVSQCLLNVINNSLEAIQEQGASQIGCVRVSSHARAEAVEIRVQDNGPGVPAKIRDRIFEPFFTTKEVGKGMGQGLSFVYDTIVTKHGGEIDIEPVPCGGTCVRMRLPTAIGVSG